MMRRLAAIVLGLAFVSTVPLGALARTGAKNDSQLLAALRSDPLLNGCRCVLGAGWIDESYPQMTVDAVRWKKLGTSARTQMSARALHIAEATFLDEFGVEDQYRQIFVVDRHGKLLAAFSR
jgi:hypothetical protein